LRTLGGLAVALSAVLTVTACGNTPAASSDPIRAATVAATSSTAPAQSSTATASPTGQDSSDPAEGAELPRGGREVFPRYRLVGYAGLTGATTLGRLGTGPLDQRVGELERRATSYAAGREILPVLEVIASIVQGKPGRDGRYRVRITDDQIATYYEAARKHKALLLLNIQPGQSEFLPEAKAYERWLKLPDVGVALDPEWAMDPGQRPGHYYGHTTGAELDGVAGYLSGLVEEYDLPEKVMVYHQVARSVIRNEAGLHQHPGVVLIKSVDGLGPPGPKITTYRAVNKTTPKFVHACFKLFFTEDAEGGGRLMSPQEVLALKPRPEYVMYE
jgi:hypothetical protein